MTKKAFKRIMAGLQDAVAYAAGEPGHGRLHKPMTPEERLAVTAEIALLLGRALKTSPEFWMNAQAATDLYEARQKLAASAQRGRQIPGTV